MTRDPTKDPFSLTVEPDLTLYYKGPSIHEGTLPALFYFALSAKDTLCKDPFNQPVQFLQDKPVRIFSLSLPEHGPHQDPREALTLWAEAIEKGLDPLTPFIDQALRAIDYLFAHNLVDHLALGGLSRGCFIASHVAAKEPRIKTLVLFAPLTRLENAKEFSHLTEHPILKSLSLSQLAPLLCNRQMRFYIGNHDTRVGTRACFEFLELLVENAIEAQIRNPKIEMVISPSTGFAGHGTSPLTFQQGVDFLVSSFIK